jgi:hypothetical protein
MAGGSCTDRFARQQRGTVPLDTFIEETMAALGTDTEEVLVERARQIRGNPGPKEQGFIAEFNEMLLAGTDPVAARSLPGRSPPWLSPGR